MVYGGIFSEDREEAFFVLQELSTVLKYLSSEIDGALEKNGEVDMDRLAKIARALSSSHHTLMTLSESPGGGRIAIGKEFDIAQE